MKSVMVWLAAMLTIAVVAGQQGDPAAAAREAMQRLSWALGEWKGSGSIQRGPGPKQHSNVHEILTSELAGAVILIKGKGTHTVEGKEQVVHNALAVLSYNAAAKKYEMKSWLANGLSTDAWIEVVDKGFDWGFDTPQGKIRYRMRINEKGQWTEKGDFSPDGEKWTEFFEMTLDKVK